MNLDLYSSDSSGSENLQGIYKDLYHLKHEQLLNMDEDYILGIAGAKVGSQIKVAVALSNFSASVYSIEEGISKVASLQKHDDRVTDIKFSPCDQRFIFTSSLDGTICLNDSRQGYKAVKEYVASCSNNAKKPFTTFDICKNGQFICGGTEVVDGNAYLTFWDFRSSKLLGGYWQSHTDDITKVLFSSKDKDLLCSGSTDGLVNFYDITQTSEDEAIINSLNSENSIDNIIWLSTCNMNSVNEIAIITHTNDIQFWRTDEIAPFAQFSRSKVASAFNLRAKSSAYVSNIVTTKDKNTLIIGGSTAGKGDTFLGLEFAGGALIPYTNFAGNKQIIRSSWFDEESEVLITGGECGFLSVWNPGAEPTKHSLKESKVPKRKGVANASKPY